MELGIFCFAGLNLRFNNKVSGEITLALKFYTGFSSIQLMKLKNYFVVAMAIALNTSLAQSPESVIVASIRETSPTVSAPNSAESLAAWRDQTFWKLYDNYRDKTLTVTIREHEAVQLLSCSGKETPNDEALLNGVRMIGASIDKLIVKVQHFREMSQEQNGILALRFLQTAVMLDMVERSQIYEQSDLVAHHFVPDSIDYQQRWKEKFKVMATALGLSEAEEKQFMPIYLRFDQECEDVVGPQYHAYGVYAGEATDFTPALARRHGFDLLDMIEREIRLKEKFFNEINATMGSSVAARFLAWEDYYSIQCKLRTMGQ